MEDFRTTLTKQIGEIVSQTVEEVAVEETEDLDDPIETSEEYKPKAWFENHFLLKEHLSASQAYETRRKKKNPPKLLSWINNKIP